MPRRIRRGTVRRRLLATFLLVEVLLTVLLVVQCWPAVVAASSQPGIVGPDPTDMPQISILWTFSWVPEPETLYIAMVLLFGAIGASVHALTSLATYIGNATFASRWTWWYLVRAPIGMAIALIFYLLLRGGLLSTGAGTDVINPYAIGSVAGLAGMFSKHATDKLEEVFKTLFRTSRGGDAERGDKLAGPALRVDLVEPPTLPAGCADRQVTVLGAGFTPASTVRIGSTLREAVVVGDTAVVVTLEPADVAVTGRLPLLVGTIDEQGVQRVAGIDLVIRPE